MYLLVKKFHIETIPFLSKSSVSYRFFPQVHTRMSLHQTYFESFDKMETITNIWQQTHRKKE